MAKTCFIVLIDGCEMRRFDNELEAATTVAMYDGDHDIWYEAEEVEA